MSAGSVCLPSVSTHARVCNAHIIIVSKMDDFLEILQSVLDPPQNTKNLQQKTPPPIVNSSFFAAFFASFKVFQ